MSSIHPVTIISLGGSLIAPATGPDPKFLSKFRDLILKLTKRGHRFVIICGGGAVCRQYQAAAKKTSSLSPIELDWLGIHVTRLNAQFLKSIFRKSAHPEIVTDPNTAPVDSPAKIIIGAGYEPGCSTDTDAVLMAKKFSATTVVNLSNITFVYDSDPRTNPNAKPFKKLTWKQFRTMFGGTSWKPGLNRPFDPVAAKMADTENMRVVIMDGTNLKNVEKALSNQSFRGTEITPS